jgi:hypothetical protein
LFTFDLLTHGSQTASLGFFFYTHLHNEKKYIMFEVTKSNKTMEKYKGFKVGDIVMTLIDYKENKLTPTLRAGSLIKIKSFPPSTVTTAKDQHFIYGVHVDSDGNEIKTNFYTDTDGKRINHVLVGRFFANEVSKDTRIKIVVIEEHTLAVIRPNSMTADVLHSSILRGATFQVLPEPMLHENRNVRLATAQDFENFRHHMKGFDNPKEYIFDTQTQYVLIIKTRGANGVYTEVRSNPMDYNAAETLAKTEQNGICKSVMTFYAVPYNGKGIGAEYYNR